MTYVITAWSVCVSVFHSVKAVGCNEIDTGIFAMILFTAIYWECFSKFLCLSLLLSVLLTLIYFLFYLFSVELGNLMLSCPQKVCKIFQEVTIQIICLTDCLFLAPVSWLKKIEFIKLNFFSKMCVPDNCTLFSAVGSLLVHVLTQ